MLLIFYCKVVHYKMMSQDDINNESHYKFDNSGEESNKNKANEVANQEAFMDLFLPITSVTFNKISKRWPLKKLSIPDTTFEQVANYM
ncbi:hypothetical protein F8M41_026413 [Gigaspora margarita]|uniref:Uncharacterized protein n=1 Tax=Gigaspora margarita TaxID=4874 RepID=A0A8H3XHI4_GIGMA|nr:hypothetical protein F8M41_026413 [Gigaspora margarita]